MLGNKQATTGAGLGLFKIGMFLGRAGKFQDPRTKIQTLQFSKCKKAAVLRG
jgi:hypothetical protein